MKEGDMQKVCAMDIIEMHSFLPLPLSSSMTPMQVCIYIIHACIYMCVFKDIQSTNIRMTDLQNI